MYIATTQIHMKPTNEINENLAMLALVPFGT